MQIGYNKSISLKYFCFLILNDLEAIDAINFEEISSLVLETGGASIEIVRFPDYEFILKLVSKARENGCLIIAEEVTTGFGRLGEWFGFQYYDIVPDMVVTGKALGNGYPISGVTINETIRKKLLKNIFPFGQSHINEPLGCAVALEVIKGIKKNNLVEKGKKVGAYFKNKLKQLQTKYPDKIKEIRA